MAVGAVLADKLGNELHGSFVIGTSASRGVEHMQLLPRHLIHPAADVVR